MKITDKNFTNLEEVIDGNEYRNCTFHACKIIYRGGTLPEIQDCNFHDCRWHFEDAAQRTVQFMKAVYHGMGADGAELVEKTMEAIRQPFPVQFPPPGVGPPV